MDERDAFWLWYDFKQIAGSAVNRQKNVDGDAFGTDWERQQQTMLLASLGLACSLIEEINRKKTCEHTTVLAHLRNALLHNGGDISKNTGAPGPLNDCESYLWNRRWLVFDPDQGRGKHVPRAFFGIGKDNSVRLDAELFMLVERLFGSFMTPAQKAMGPPQ